jgi:hypothetical protein
MAAAWEDAPSAQWEDAPSPSDYSDDDSPEAMEAKGLGGANLHDGTTVGGAVNAAATGINSGLTTQLAGFPVDVAEQVKELGKAAIGYPYSKITGKVAPDALQPDTDPEAVVGSSAYLAKKAREAGAGSIIDPYEHTPTTDIINQGASMLAPSILQGGAIATERGIARVRGQAPVERATPAPPAPVDGPVTAEDLKNSPERLTGAPEPAPAPTPAPTPAGKPKIVPKAGESAQQAAERQGLAQPAAAAPGPAPARAATATTDPTTAIKQLNADTGGALPEVRTSALNGDHAATAVDHAHSTIEDEPGQRMAGVIRNENDALTSASQKIVDGTGGTAVGTENTALQDRGTVIDRALGGIRDWFDTNRKQMYADADRAAGGVPMTKFDSFHSVLSDPSKFTGAEGMQLHGDIQNMAQHFGLMGQDGFWKPTTAANVERFRQWVGEQYTPRTGKTVKLLKDSLDNDVAAHGGQNFYAGARALRTKQAAMLERENSISRLIPERNPDGTLSTNRPVPVNELADHIAGQTKEQFDHLINTLHDSAKLGNGELAEGNAAALRELKAHMAERLHEAGVGKPGTNQRLSGRWDSVNYHKKLDAYSLNMPSLFTPGERARLQTVHDAGNALHMDKNYPKTAELQRRLAAGTGSTWRQNVADSAVGGIESVATLGAHAVIPGSGAFVGPAMEMSGASRNLRSKFGGANRAMRARAAEVEGRISQLGNEPGGATPPAGPRGPLPSSPTGERTQPLGQRMGGKQRGATGELNNGEPGSKYPVLSHQYDPDSGEHVVKSPFGETHAQDHGNDIRVLRTDTRPEGEGRGEGTARMAQLADVAHARGGNLLSGINGDSVSPGQKGVIRNLARDRGYKVERNPNATMNETTGNEISDDFNKPVYTIKPRPAVAADTRPLGSRIPGQRGGPKFTPKAEPAEAGYQAPKELENFVRKSAPVHHVDPKGPTNFEELMARKGEKSMPVNPQEAEGSIYSNTKTNIAFRAWHDKLHQDLNAGFDHEGEMKVALEHQRQAKEAGLSEESQRALWADTWETFKHHEDTGSFPSKPREFVAQQMQKQFPGDEKAMVNIGLHQGDPANGGRVMKPGEATAALRSTGVKIGKTSIQTGGSEPTMVASLDRPLTREEMQSVMAKTKQSSIPQRFSNGAGEIHVAPGQEAVAAKQGWDKYDPNQFQMHDARSATEHDAERQAYSQIKPHLTPAEASDIENRAPAHRTAAIKNLLDTFHGSTSIEGTSAMALAGQAKKGWYEKAGKAINSVFGPDAPRFTALLAAMSPQTSVEMNFHNALHTFVNWDKAGRPTDAGAIKKIMEDSSLKNPESESDSNVMDAWHQNGVRALTSKDPEHEGFQLSGPKVDSFYKNLRGNTHEVTNDSWNAIATNIDQKLFSAAYRKVAGDIFGRLGFKSPTYMGVSAKVRAAALQLSKMTGEAWTPSEVQETMWSFVKTAFEHAKATGKSIPELMKSGELNDQLIRGTSDFHSLFGAPEHAGFLDDSRFGKAARRVASQPDTARPAPSEASKAAAEALRPHLEAEGERLEGARQARLANRKARIGNIQVPF